MLSPLSNGAERLIDLLRKLRFRPIVSQKFSGHCHLHQGTAIKGRSLHEAAAGAFNLHHLNNGCYRNSWLKSFPCEEALKPVQGRAALVAYLRGLQANVRRILQLRIPPLALGLRVCLPRGTTFGRRRRQGVPQRGSGRRGTAQPSPCRSMAVSRASVSRAATVLDRHYLGAALSNPSDDSTDLVRCLPQRVV